MSIPERYALSAAPQSLMSAHTKSTATATALRSTIVGKESDHEHAPVLTFGLRMSDHDLLLFFNMSNKFLAPGGLNAECIKVNVM